MNDYFNEMVMTTTQMCELKERIVRSAEAFEISEKTRDLPGVFSVDGLKASSFKLKFKTDYWLLDQAYQTTKSWCDYIQKLINEHNKEISTMVVNIITKFEESFVIEISIKDAQL